MFCKDEYNFSQNIIFERNLTSTEKKVIPWNKTNIICSIFEEVHALIHNLCVFKPWYQSQLVYLFKIIQNDIGNNFADIMHSLPKAMDIISKCQILHNPLIFIFYIINNYTHFIFYSTASMTTSVFFKYFGALWISKFTYKFWVLIVSRSL